jgi:hypothetical protein
MWQQNCQVWYKSCKDLYKIPDVYLHHAHRTGDGTAPIGTAAGNGTETVAATGSVPSCMFLLLFFVVITFLYKSVQLCMSLKAKLYNFVHL